MKILLLEDNQTIVKGLVFNLKQNGYEVDYAYDIKTAVNKIDENIYDLTILDVSLPDGNGFDFYREYIKKQDIATIFLTAKDTEADIVRGLNYGAEDYITKPFSTKELIARIERIKRKNKNEIIINNIKYDFNKMLVYKDSNLINLTSLELKISHVLFLNLNKVVTRDYLIECIWKWTGNDVYDNTITVYLKRIREKIGADIITTVKGMGYRIDEKK